MLLEDKASSTLMDSEILLLFEHLQIQEDLGRISQHKRDKWHFHVCCSNDTDTGCISQSQFCLRMYHSGRGCMMFVPVCLEMCLQHKVGTVFDLEKGTKW